MQNDIYFGKNINTCFHCVVGLFLSCNETSKGCGKKWRHGTAIAFFLKDLITISEE